MCGLVCVACSVVRACEAMNGGSLSHEVHTCNRLCKKELDFASAIFSAAAALKDEEVLTMLRFLEKGGMVRGCGLGR